MCRYCCGRHTIPDPDDLAPRPPYSDVQLTRLHLTIMTGDDQNHDRQLRVVRAHLKTHL